MKRNTYLVISLFVIVIELVLCFAGPMALMTTPSLMVTPIYNAGGNAEEVENTFLRVEQLAAKTGSFNVLSKQRLEDYFNNSGEGNIGFTYSKTLNYKEYLKIADNLGIERILLTILAVDSKQAELTTFIRDVKSGQIVTKSKFKSNNIENLLLGVGSNGNDLKMVEALTIGTNGISLFDKLFFLLILCQLVYTVLYYLKKDKRGYEEFIISFSLMMFLFAFIYALNANMSYVQLFIAQMGEIGMAESTEKEQLFALIRFLPFILINLVVYIRAGLSNRREGGYRDKVRLWGFPITLLSAFIFSISYPSFLSIDGYGILAWVALVPLFYVIQLVPKRVGVFYVLVFGGLQTILINYWHGTFKLIALPFSTILSILFYLPFAVILVYLIRVRRKYNYLIIPVIWVVFDFLRSIGFTGYPWGIIGTSQYQFPAFNQLASITGIWGLSFIVLLCNSSIAHLLLNWRKKMKFIPLVIFSSVFVVNVIFGFIYIGYLDHEEPIDKVKISLIQQNSDPRRHIFHKTFKSLKELTDKSIKKWGEAPDLVVWSEGAFKRDIGYFSMEENLKGAESNGVGELKEFIRERGIWLLTGSQNRRVSKNEDGEEERKNYNSSVFLNPNGGVEDIYHKIHLVPFSEYFPYKKEFPFIAGLLRRFNTSNWSVGERRFSFEHPKFKFSTPICFEDVFGSELREFVKSGTDVFVNISNDFWAMTPVEAKQHGVNGLFRTIENRRAMVRSTCAGYTVYYDRAGRIVDEAQGYYIESYVNSEVPIYNKSWTIYTKLGDWFPILGMILLMVYVVIFGIERLRKG